MFSETNSTKKQNPKLINQNKINLGSFLSFRCVYTQRVGTLFFFCSIGIYLSVNALELARKRRKKDKQY